MAYLAVNPFRQKAASGMGPADVLENLRLLQELWLSVTGADPNPHVLPGIG